MPVYRASTTVDASPEEVLAWHERPGALQRLLPPWEDIRVERRDPTLEEGAAVVLRIRKGPLDVRWEAVHRGLPDGVGFIDEQVSGPFQRWVHTHRFRADGAGRCVVEDEVDWEPPLGSMGDLLAAPVLERELARMFAFRHQRLAHDLAVHREWADHPRLTVAITGASGLIGTALSHLLTSGGHRVVPMVRSREQATGRAVYWSASKGEIDLEGLRGVDALVHLAGEPIRGVRWTESKKKAIRDSRVQGTELLSRSLAGFHDGPSIFVMASGVHYHGDRGEEIITDETGPGKGFLSRVCQEWEGAARRAEGSGIRVVKIRNGFVVSAAGGALPLVLSAFKTGLGGRVGGGRQYVPWVDLDDNTAILYRALMSSGMKGAYLGTAPHPVTNATFTDVLGRVLHRPTLIPVPKLAVKAALGQMGEELVLSSQRTRPTRLLDAGFRFRYQSFEESLRHQLGRSAG